MSKQQQLEELNKEWIAKELPLKATATQGVPGEGDPDAALLFVGEGPGKDEDEQGRPFVGAAGRFLTELIESIGLKRANVFIANMVKHRPPGNRDPLPEELTAYAPWLDGQVAIIQPKLIVTLGRYSMAHFLGETLSISKIHGQPKRNKKDQVVIPMYHPAAALYRGNLRPVLLTDFQNIPKVLKLLKQGNPINKEEESQKEILSQQKQAALF